MRHALRPFGMRLARTAALAGLTAALAACGAATTTLTMEPRPLYNPTQIGYLGRDGLGVELHAGLDEASTRQAANIVAAEFHDRNPGAVVEFVPIEPGTGGNRIVLVLDGGDDLKNEALCGLKSRAPVTGPTSGKASGAFCLGSVPITGARGTSDRMRSATDSGFRALVGALAMRLMPTARDVAIRGDNDCTVGVDC